MLITVTYKGPTNTKGSRFIVKARGKRKVYHYDHSQSSREVYVDRFLKDTGIGAKNEFASLHFIDIEGPNTYYALLDLRV